MHKKSNIFKRTLSMILAFTLVCGALVFTANAENDFFNAVKNNPTDLVVIVSETDLTKYSYTKITEEKEPGEEKEKIKVTYTVYADKDEMDAVTGLSIKPAEVPGLTYKKPHPTVTGVEVWDIEGNDKQPNMILSTNGSINVVGFKDPSDVDYEAVRNWYDEEKWIFTQFTLTYTVDNPVVFKAYLDSVNGTFKFKTTTQFDSEGIKGEDPVYIEPTYLSMSDNDAADFTVGTLYDLRYNFDDGICDDPTSLPKATKVAEGDEYEIPEVVLYKGSVATNNKEALSKWIVTRTDNTQKVAEVSRGGKFIMPDGPVEVKAVYAPDKNDNNIPDEEEVKVIYAIEEKAGEKGAVLDLTGYDKYVDVASDNTSAAANLVAGVEGGGKTLGVTVPGVIPDDAVTAAGNKVWSLVGYYIGDTKYTAEELANYELVIGSTDFKEVVGEDTPILNVEIRMLKDADEDGEDDRDLVNVTVTYNDEPVEVVDGKELKDLPKNAPYEIYDGKGTKIGGDNADNDKIALTDSDIPPKNDKRYPVTKVTAEVVKDDVTGKATGVKINVTYDDKVATTSVDPGEEIIDGTKVPEVITDKPFDLEKDAVIIFRDQDKNEIVGKNVTIVEGVEITYPVKGTDFDEFDGLGNEFDKWKITGKTEEGDTFGEALDPDAEYDFPHYFMDPVYKKAVAVKIIKDGQTEPIFSGDVPIGKEYKVVDKDGNPVTEDKDGNPIEGTSGTITGEGDIIIPASIDDKITVKDGDKYFQGNWKSDKDDKGNIVIEPLYEEAKPENIIITPVDPNGEGGENKARAAGYTVLKGKYTKQDKDLLARAYFKVSVCGVNPGPSDKDKIKAVAYSDCGFDKFSKTTYGDFTNKVVINDITYGKFEYDSVKSTDEEAYFYTEYKMNKSGIVTINMTYENSLGTKEGKHDVIMVGDVNKSDKITIMDLLEVNSFLTGEKAKPGIASEVGSDNYLFELADINKSKTITIMDLTELNMMLTGDKPINN